MNESYKTTDQTPSNKKKNAHVMQFSNVKVRVLWRDWLIREITSATREHKRIKRGKRGEKL